MCTVHYSFCTCMSTGIDLSSCKMYIAACSSTSHVLSEPGNPPSPPAPPGKATPHKLDKCLSLQAQAALSGQLVVARQQHADVCMQLQKEHAALQQAALQEHASQKVTWPHLAAVMYPPCLHAPPPCFGSWTHAGEALPLDRPALCLRVSPAGCLCTVTTVTFWVLHRECKLL